MAEALAGNTPERIRLTLATEAFPGSSKVTLHKGYYSTHWYWSRLPGQTQQVVLNPLGEMFTHLGCTDHVHYLIEDLQAPT